MNEETVIGNHCKEHGMYIHTTHGVVKQNEKVQVETVQPKQEEKPRCPLFDRLCTEKCALNTGSGCAFIVGTGLNPAGLCPLNGKPCKDKCIMNKKEYCALAGRKDS